MNNIIIGIISIIITYSLCIISYKLFKKEGLYTWIVLSTIVANILVCKSVEIFSFITSLGNTLFSSSFLASDILNEKYGGNESKKAIKIAVFSTIVFIIVIQLGLLYKPSSIDLANNHLKELFSLNLRVSISSILMYYISNYLNIYLYNYIKKINNKLWIRNNISTIISNVLENFIFTIIAFIGIYSIKDIIEIVLVASIIEIFLAIIDTPFFYLSVRDKNKN